MVPCPISERAMRMTTLSSGLITTQAVTSGEPSAARTTLGTERKSTPSASPPPKAAALTTKATAIDLRNVIHGRLPHALARGVDRRAHLLEGAAAADVGDGAVDVGVARLRLVL